MILHEFFNRKIRAFSIDTKKYICYLNKQTNRFFFGISPFISTNKLHKGGGIFIREHWTYGYYSDTGKSKEKNEDSLLLQHIQMKQGELLLACICDGMGGLAEGEIASGYVCEELGKWFYKDLFDIVQKPLFFRSKKIRNAGFRCFQAINEAFIHYQQQKGYLLGTTATVWIAYKRKYYAFHIGDSCIISFCKDLKYVTKAHAKSASCLTKCLGIHAAYKPDFCTGRIRKGDSFLLGSDGFIRKIKAEEMKKSLETTEINTAEKINKRLAEIAKRSMIRGEKDNLSAIFLKYKA